MIFHVFGSIAELERERIGERTRERLAAAHERGRVGGRPLVLAIERKFELGRPRDQEGRPIGEIAHIFNVSTATIRRVPFYSRPKG